MIVRHKKLSKRKFASEVGKSPRTVERWIKDGFIPAELVYKDATGHIFINEKAIAHVFIEDNAYNRLTRRDIRVRV